MKTPKEIILKAFKEGKIVQSRNGNGWKDFIPQNQLDTPNLDYGGIDNWRIKPVNKPHVNIGKIIEPEKPETLYRKVAVSERKPEQKGIYLVWNFGVPMAVLYDNVYSFHEEHIDCTGITHWFEEISDFIPQTKTIETLLRMNAQLQADKEELQNWKDSAMEVMNDLNLQEIGKILKLELGTSISKQLFSKVSELVADKEELLEALEKIYRIGHKPYRNTRNEEIEINQIAESLLQKHRK